MNFLFSSAVVDRGEQIKYRVYEFKLFPGKYRAELIVTNGGAHLKEVIFWKVRNKWKTDPPTKSAQYLAEVIARDIEKRKD